MANDTTKLAVLIDADNARPAIVEGLPAEVAKYGTAHVKRFYGDWTKPDLSGWKEVLLRHAIEAASDDTGWAGLDAIESIINKQSPDFDSRNYGCAKLSGLVSGLGLFDTEERHIGNGKHFYVRPRENKK